MAKATKKLIIIDANALIHRAFHALPPLTNKAGQLTNAVYGFTLILLKAIKSLQPDYLVAAFDLKAKTFRHEAYEEYKATRKKQPQELYDQIPLVKEVLQSFNIPIFEKAGLEADDLIGTIAHLKSIDRPEIETIIVTGDQDVFQLIDENTKALSPHKGLSETVLYDVKTIKEKFGGLNPKQLIDFKALRGDPSDNIPGIKGIGEKGAIDLLNNFQTLEKIYQNLNSDKIKERTKKLLTEQKANAFLSKKLATIVTDAPIKFDLNDCAFSGFDKSQVIVVFQKLNFTSLLNQLANLNSRLKIKGEQGSLFCQLATPTKEEKVDYQLIASKKAAQKFLSELKKQKEFALDTETTGLDPFTNELVGIGFAWQKNQATYLPVEQLKTIKKELAAILKNSQVKKIGNNLKYDLAILAENDLPVAGVYFDTMIASYLLNPGNRQHNLNNLAFVELGREMQKIQELIGEGKNQITLKEVPLAKVAHYCGADADTTFQLYKKLKAELEKQNLFNLLEKIEMPLVQVLTKVEQNGVKINAPFLNKLAKQTGEQIKKLEKKIHQLAKTKFNIASPLQLKEILFKKLKISSQELGKTKTGISTAADELEKLRGQHEIIDLILEYRELAKLKNTYLDALPQLVNKKDGRVHTSFNQTVTATGRLSSSNPNLQNIPIRTSAGQKIRQAFVAEKGNQIVKADYSQIELRIVASLANDKKMLAAFENKVDIHTQTAALINDLPPEKVTPILRRQAKEVNFGVLYGMGAWGLAQRTGLSPQKAKEFIDRYFENYQAVKKYLVATIEMAREKGYVETFYGRRRYLPEINSGISQVRGAAERMAVNMPVQGTAADLIKLAMIAIDQKLPKISPASKMILQVHDELVFEVPQAEVTKVAKLIEQEMNGVYRLRAKIETEISAGPSWGETEKL